MRSSQWFIIGLAFLLLGIFFIQQDMSFEKSCGTPAGGLDLEEGFEPLQRYELWCINTEIFDPFIWIFHVFWIVCWINGWIEHRAEKRRK